MRPALTSRGPRALAAACALLLVACADDSPGTVHLYDPAPVPGVPDRTREIDPEATELAAGQYWATLTGDSDPQVLTFELTQALFADACIRQLGEDECTNGFGTVDEPTRMVAAPVAPLTNVTVVGGNQQNYAITGEELLAIAGGAAPDTGAPAGFAYTDLPFLLTVRGGTIVEAHQIWVP